MSSLLPSTWISRSARSDSVASGIGIDGSGRWRLRRQRQQRRPRPLSPPLLAAAAAAAPGDDSSSIPLGAQCGVRVPRLILGTMQFGEALSPEESHEIMNEAEAKSPLLALDTAEAYPVPMAASTSGDSERIIGDWLRAGGSQTGNGRRESAVLITKVSGPGDQRWLRGGPPRLDGRHLLQALEGSLRRLRVEEVDLLMLHWPDRYVPMFGEVDFDPSRSFFKSGNENENDDDGFAETERHFEDVLSSAFDAVSAGKIRAVGLSNETPTGLLAATSASRRRRRKERRKKEEEEAEGGVQRQRQQRQQKKKLLLFPGVAAVSNAYSLLARDFDSNGMAEACAATRVPLLGYGPLAAGLLSGKYETDETGREKGEEFSGGPPLSRLNRYRHEYAEEGKRYARTPRVREAVRSYVEIAQRHGLRGGGAELALRFALFSSRPSSFPSAAVFGATSVENVRAAFAAAAQGPLSREVVSECDAVHARNPNPAP